MPSITDLLAIGLTRYQSGDVAGAEALYRSAVSLNPKHPDGWARLGIACLTLGKLV